MSISELVGESARVITFPDNDIGLLAIFIADVDCYGEDLATLAVARGLAIACRIILLKGLRIVKRVVLTRGGQGMMLMVLIKVMLGVGLDRMDCVVEGRWLWRERIGHKESGS
jgi:hypothetical protein